MMRAPVRAQPLQIPGPAGPLESLVEVPEGFAGQRFAVICHPHPQFGGTLSNKVVHTVARALQEAGLATVRFNFRGVGASAGTFDHGRGEGADLEAAVAWGNRRWPQASLWLGGFSFGAIVAIRATHAAGAQRLITIAPAVRHLESEGVVMPSCPWLIVQGTDDEVVSAQRVAEWARALSPAPQMRLIAGASHFFHGKLRELHAAVLEFARAPR
jgi:alpha/beta superfamily hydrolase